MLFLSCCYRIGYFTGLLESDYHLKIKNTCYRVSKN